MATRAVLLHRVNLFNIWFGSNSGFLFHPVDYLGQQLDTRFSFSFHQEDNAFSEKLVILEFLLSQVQMNRSLQIVVGFIEIFMLDFYFGNLVKG